MAIRSNAFGRITLTGPDAKKFRNQASYGKPKAAAAKNVKKGLLMLKQATSSRNRLVFKIHTRSLAWSSMSGQLNPAIASPGFLLVKPGIRR